IAGIGLSHLIHAVRRNLDVTVIMVNNMIYGMTGGQVAATTPLATKTATTPYGGFAPPLDIIRLVVSAGAVYAARWTTAHPKQLTDAIKKALTTKGFSFVEAVSQCPTAYGRRAGFKNAGEMLRWLRKQSMTLAEAKERPEDQEGRIVVGEFETKVLPTLTERIQAVLTKAKKHD
ncbi:MAG: 2-oxoacid:ferredoxin oxidoreductase subunit beta, partial [Candidatus Bathyarchaeota archaeon]